MKSQPIMDEIEARILAQRRSSDYTQRDHPPYTGTVYPGRPADIPYDLPLYATLDRLNSSYNQFEHGLALTETAVSRLPLLGQFWRWLRVQIHGTALYYVNRTLQQQIALNRQLTTALGQLTAVTQQQQRQITALQAELARQTAAE